MGAFLKKSWLMIVMSLVFGGLVGFIYQQLQPRIQQNMAEEINQGMTSLLPSAQSYEAVTGEDGAVLYRVGKGSDGHPVGYAIQAEGAGFADTIGLLIAIEEDLETLAGIAILSSNETPGYGDKINNPPFRGQFADCPVDQPLTVVKSGDREKRDPEIVAITGATISSRAVVSIVNDAVTTLKQQVK